uniref:Immunoglobulin V-set domain-containing protein n=1 Tax=Leptobrachium leishanense TaxID=445787 RepID=A0A8C5WFR2_9ANUR
SPIMCGIMLLIVPPDHGVYSIEGPGELVISNGGSLHVTFTYSRRYQNYMKYWCKGGYRPHCKVLISIQNDVFISRGRFSIRDDERKMQITVTMTGMQPNDSDIYHCGIQRLRQDVMHRVNVTVLPGNARPLPCSGLSNDTLHDPLAATVLEIPGFTRTPYLHQGISLGNPRQLGVPRLSDVITLCVMTSGSEGRPGGGVAILHRR